MATILVTGAAGFIGSHLAEKLVSEGHAIIGIDNYSEYYSPDLKRENAAELNAKGVEIIETDLSNDELVLPEGVEYIYHLAAQPGIASHVPFTDYVVNNIDATNNLLRAACNLKNLKQFFFISTSSVYGKEAVGSEDAVPKPASAYGVTKLAAEQLALSYARNSLLSIAAFRLFSVYGPRERPEKLFSKLITAMLMDESFPLFEGSLEHIRSYTYVSDIVDGLVLALERDDISGTIFNLGTEEIRTTREGIGIVEKLLDKKADLTITPKRSGDQTETRAVIEKAKSVLGYCPSVSLEEGLKKQIAWSVARSKHS